MRPPSHSPRRRAEITPPRRQVLSRLATFTVLLLALALMACAHEKPAPVVDVASLPPLPRSSIAAVVQQRAKLGLTDDQVRALEEIDQEREKADASFMDEVAQKKKAAQAASSGSGPPAGGGAGGGMGGGGMRGGGMRGGSMGGRRGSPPGGNQATAETAPATIQDRLDDDDTKAFLDAEQVLTEAQRDPAREIASDYRAQRYERRELERQGGSAK
jgi:hypothetical protein